MSHWRLRATLLAAAAVVVVLVWSGVPAFAGDPALEGTFHAAGKLVCSQCHTMHYSVAGVAPTGAPPFPGSPGNADAGGPFKHLLTKSKISDLCLTCHDLAGSNAAFVSGTSTPPKVKGAVVNKLPGGNFTDTAATAAGLGKGHKVNATGFTAGLATAPGSSPAWPPGGTTFECTSCHDPHEAGGLVFGFRLLKTTINGTVVAAAEMASVDATDGANLRAGAIADCNVATTDTNHSVYRGTDWGKWCGTCHGGTAVAGGFHVVTKADASNAADGVDWRKHPTNTVLPAAYLANYTASYTATYPVNTVTAGATWSASYAMAATDKVFCLSCHAAHGTTFVAGVRWDMSAVQPVLTNCNKCHGK